MDLNVWKIIWLVTIIRVLKVSVLNLDQINVGMMIMPTP